MSGWTAATIAWMEDSERDVLERIETWLERLDRRIADGAENLTGLRSEVEITRISYEHQLALTRRVIERFLRRMDREDELIEQNVAMLRSLRDHLTGGGNGPGPE